MYDLRCDGVLIARTAADALSFESGSLLERVSSAGVFSCTLQPENPYQNMVALRSSVLTLERAGSEIFRGQAISTEVNEDGFFLISGLGDMSYLRDVLISPFTFTGTLSALFGQILTYYNARATAKKRIYKGTVEIAGNISYELTSCRTAWDLISDLTETYGGVLEMLWKNDGTRGINWLINSHRFSDQAALWGDNLLSLQIEQDASDVVNTLIAEGDEGLTVTRSNSASVAQYGAVYGYQRFQGVTTSAALQTAADAALAEMKSAARSVAGHAIDKWEKGFEPFRVGDFVRAISRVHLLDEWIVVSELRHDLTMAKPLQVTLGRIGDSMTASGRTGLINKWIAGTQGQTPPLYYAVDADGVYAVDADGYYALAMSRS